MYLSEKLTPDFRTISDFRKDNPDLIKEVFRHTVQFAREEGLLDLFHLSTDGSKVKANASNRRVLTKEELAVLLQFVDGELEEWAQQDTLEDTAYGNLRGMDQLPDRSKKMLQTAARYYVKRIKERGPEFKEEVQANLQKAQEVSEDEGLKKVSITDPDSRFMKNKKGKIELSYNPQITVDKAGFVLASDVCQNASDSEQLQPQVQQTGENLGYFPEHVVWSFDAGYFESDNLQFLADRNIDGYVPDNNEGKESNPFDKKNFLYDPQKDEYVCPAGEKVVFLGIHFDKQKNKEMRVYKGQSCRICTSQERCTRQRKGIRYLKMSPHEAARDAMVAKMKTPQAKEIYKLRQTIVEPVMGDIKENKSVRAFLCRGITAERNEFNVICAAVNIKRIWKRKMEDGGPQHMGRFAHRFQPA